MKLTKFRKIIRNAEFLFEPGLNPWHGVCGKFEFFDHLRTGIDIDLCSVNVLNRSVQLPLVNRNSDDACVLLFTRNSVGLTKNRFPVTTLTLRRVASHTTHFILDQTFGD